MNHGRLWTLENKHGFKREGVGKWISLLMGFKRGMDFMEEGIERKRVRDG